MQVLPGSAHGRRQTWALILVGCVLVFLMIATVTTVQAYVTKMGETTLVDFASGEFYRTSLLEAPPDIESIQLVPVGLSGQWGIEPHSLPIALTELAAVAGRNEAADKGHVVVMGGFDADHHLHAQVYVSAINADGSLNPWVEQTAAPLPKAVSSAAAAIYRRDANSSWIYLLGGISGGYPINDVYYTILDHNTGSIAPWTLNPQPLPFPLYYEAVAAHNGYVYLVGGYDDEYLEALNTVYYAQIQADGSLGAWQETAGLPEDELLSSHLVVAYNEGDANTLYTIGGWAKTGAANSSFRVYFADIKPDGSLYPWTLSKASLSTGIYGHSGAQVNGQILLTGGRDWNNTISDTVKAALIDPTDAERRLYDWCRGLSPDECDISPWQSGPILPEPRAFHVTVEDGGYIYTIGGVGSDGQPSNVVFWGSTNELGGRYAPWGRYVSSEFDFRSPVTIRQIEWETLLAAPGDMSLQMSYRYKPQGGDWQAWSAPVESDNGTNTWVIDPPVGNVRLFQYRVDMTTEIENISPRLNSLDVFYEVDDPDLEISKNSGSLISVTQNTHLDYTIYYTNSGDWIAKDAVLTETLPANTAYDGGSEWQRVGTTNVYTYHLGDLTPGASGHVPFNTRVLGPLPEDLAEIVNTVKINYPPMTDAIGQTIVDPQMGNNEAEWINPVSLIGLAVSKTAQPDPDTIVHPGSRITYTLSYTNVGRVATESTILTEIFDPEGDYTILSADPEPDEGDNVWHLGTLAARQSGQIKIVVQVDDPLPDDWPVTNQATLYSPIDELRWTDVLTHTVMNGDDSEPVAMVDLVVTDLRWVPAAPTAGQPVRFYASIANEGDKPVDSAFWVEVYIKPSPSLPPSKPGDHELGFCVGTVCNRDSYLVQPAGLPANSGADVMFQGPGLSFPEAGKTYDIYVQIDVADVPVDNSYWGRFAERDETNNMAHLTYTTPGDDGPPRIFLPIISRP